MTRERRSPKPLLARLQSSPAARLVLIALGLASLPPGFVGDLGAEQEKMTPVVLELFTSQGCSSCPAADRLLTRLGHESFEGIEVVPLSFHVDYWNYIG